MSFEKKYVLAIESGLEGGSLSVWADDAEIDCRVGTNAVSKAEDLLEGVSVLLKRNGLNGGHLRAIAAATEAGSATGLKIGQATARGLAKAFGCDLLLVSTWGALAAHLNQTIQTNKNQTSAIQWASVYLPHGKKNLERRDFEDGKFTSDARVLNAGDFQADSASVGNHRLYAHRTILQVNSTAIAINGIKNKINQPSDLGDNFAYYIAKFTAGKIASDNE